MPANSPVSTRRQAPPNRQPHPVRTITVILITAVLAFALPAVAGPTAQPAYAHDQLVSTDPEDGSVLTQAPAEVSLVFSDEVLDVSATIIVTGPTGDVPVTAVVDDRNVTATLPQGLTSGSYQVAWRVVSSDGHPIQGSFSFTVADDATASSSHTPTATTPTKASTGPDATDASSEHETASPQTSAPEPSTVPAIWTVVAVFATLAFIAGVTLAWRHYRDRSTS